MQRLTRFLVVEEEAGEVLHDAQAARGQEELHGRDAIAHWGLQLERERAPCSIRPLARILRAEEVDASRVHVVLAHHARRLAVRRVGAAEHAKQSSQSQLSFVLRHGAGARARAVDPEPCALAELRSGEGPLPLASRCPEREEAARPVRTGGGREAKSTVAHAQLVPGAPCLGEIALARIEWPLRDLQALDQLGDDEVGVRISVAVRIVDLVDGDAVHAELDGLALLGVEPAQEHLLGMALPALVGDEDAGRQLEQVLGVLARDDRQLPDVDHEVAGPVLHLALVSADGARAGAASNRKGMRTRASNGWPSRRAGLNFQRITAATAAESSAAPADC